MKRFLCFLFMLWLAAQASLAQAHVVAEDLHALTHAVQALDVQQADVDHQDDPCGVTHCCHPTGFFTNSPSVHLPAPMAGMPSMAESANSRTPPHEIERPKWALATTAVASL